MKIKCTKCGEEKPPEGYYKQPRNKSGLMGHCKVCELKRKKENESKHKELNPEAWIERRRGYVRTYKQKNPERVAELDWSYKIKTRFNIDADSYYRMLEEQNGVCSGCLKAPNGKKLAIDHDRKCCDGDKSCGKCVRGLLCSNCNTALGLLKENKDTIARLLEYIKEKDEDNRR